MSAHVVGRPSLHAVASAELGMDPLSHHELQGQASPSCDRIAAGTPPEAA